MKNILDVFGKVLITEVRDRSISDFDMILDGKMKGITAKTIKEEMKGFSKQQIEVIKWLIPKVVDVNLNHLLEMIESINYINVQVILENCKYCVKELSDGLSGELYTEEGWIYKFSKERYDEL